MMNPDVKNWTNEDYTRWVSYLKKLANAEEDPKWKKVYEKQAAEVARLKWFKGSPDERIRKLKVARSASRWVAIGAAGLGTAYLLSWLLRKGFNAKKQGDQVVVPEDQAVRAKTEASALSFAFGNGTSAYAFGVT